MDFDSMAYPDILVIGSGEHKGSRNIANNTLLIPYSVDLDVGIGDIITQRIGSREIRLKVIDVSFAQGGTMNIGTPHPNLAKLKIENLTAIEHLPKEAASVINIGNLNGQQVQVGNNNNQTVNISLQQLVEAVAKSNDEEAKGALRKLFDNGTVASVVGAGLTSLLGMIS
ncbi:hypothetical protein OO258_11605 [Pseudomonas sp. DCB_BI]|uniref:hypothetical protein n=1 Tax=Pseudomonas sp. DCB_BI TaxID=2993594 RepID=UPI00224AB5D2|nr:hypothetical protein [Pseudomonas sp. DCB_BI]MCX2888881.1 hypothetical protein [Pseudomonas sp. DCB_BI]